MLEAAKIDGAGFFGLYRRIVFPLSISGFVVVIIWQFTQSLERVSLRRHADAAEFTANHTWRSRPARGRAGRGLEFADGRGNLGGATDASYLHYFRALLYPGALGGGR